MAYDGSGEGGHHQAFQVVVAQPGGEHAAVFGFGGGGADADAHRFDAPAVPVHLRHVFAKRFGQAVKAVGLGRHAGVDDFVLAVKTRHMVGAGKHNALHTLQASSFVQIDHARDVAGQNHLPGLFGGHAAQVHHSVHLVKQVQHLVFVFQSRDLYLFTLSGWAQVGAIAQAQHLAVGFEARAQFAS